VQRGEAEAAKAYQLQAMSIRQRRVPDSGVIGDDLLWLARACMGLGELDEAEGHLHRALELSGGDSARGEISAQIVDSLGEVVLRRGDVKAAERLHRWAFGLWEGFGGPDHPMVSTPLLGLAADLRAQGRYPEAFDAAERAQALRLAHLRFSSRALTEREALAYGETQDALEMVLTLASEAGDRIPHARRRALDAVVPSRAVVLDELAARHRSLSASADPELARLAADHGSARDSLARLAVQGPAEDDAGDYEKELAEARTAKDRAERALAARSSVFQRELAREAAGLDDIAGRVSPAGALVSFVAYRPVAAGSGPRQQGSPSGQPPVAYAAFVLPQGSADPAFVPLGPAGEIEPLVAELRRLLSSPLPGIPTAEQRAEKLYRSVGARLREAVWDPMTARLGGASRVLVAPDGALNLVDLAALPVGESRYLVESGIAFHYLSAERDLLGYGAAPGGGGLLAMGDPAFDEPTVFAALAPGGVPLQLDPSYEVASAAAYRGSRPACSGFRALRFAPLPASDDEVDGVVALWRARSQGQVFDLRGPSASETAFKALAPRAGTIHLATHGFLLGEGCAADTEAATFAGASPLLLSGFALAGANHRSAAAKGEEDGILTAEEVAALDLTGVSWAVLSGCNTGVGEVRSGEGVFGLRRAFELAGARTLIMSLYPVGDEATREWMRALYENRLERGMSTADAVHRAKLDLLLERRAEGPSTLRTLARPF